MLVWRLKSSKTWEFPKIRATFLGGPYIKDSSIFGSILGFFYFGKLPSVQGCDCFELELVL